MASVHPLADLAAELVRRYALMAADMVVEVGSGDGQFLRTVRALGPRAVGVEPDVKTANRAWVAGTDTVAAFFGPGVADYIRSRYGPARVVMTRSVRAVGDDLSAFLTAAAHCLAPGGVIAVHAGGINALVELRPDPSRIQPRAA
ncbi:MAG: hypothetical protein JWO38_572 [Gemmataceae bacterium]|nr:hypothetical protein [Gemmataceae bacterium]